MRSSAAIRHPFRISRALKLQTRTKLIAAAALVVGMGSVSRATTLFWDTTAGAGVGGNGTWDVGSTANWNTDSTGTSATQVWTNGSDAVFNGPATFTSTIAAGTTINANSLTFGINAGNTTVTGGTALNIASTTNSITMNTGSSGSARAQIISSPIGGTSITVVRDSGAVSTLLTLNGANTFTGNLIYAGGGTGISQVNINQLNALPSTATSSPPGTPHPV